MKPVLMHSFVLGKRQFVTFFGWGLLGKDVLCSGVEKKWELVTFGDVSGVLLHQDEVF